MLSRERRESCCVERAISRNMWGVPTYIVDLINAGKMEHIKIYIKFIFSLNKFNVCDLWFSQQR
jgi:hypothetical protein